MAAKLIYHSDDLGATSKITRRILEAWESGLLDGFSIFANTDSFPEIAQSLNQHSQRNARISVHLNLWEGKPVLPVKEVRFLVDDSAFFNVEFFGIWKRYLSASRGEKKTLLDQVEQEWRAQIEKVINAVKPRVLSAIDGHIHIHMLPFLFRIAARLAKEYHIPEIRIVNEPFCVSQRIKECYTKNFLMNVIKHIVLQLCVPLNLETAKRMSLRYPDAMLGVLYSGMMGRSNIWPGIRASEKKGARSIEILMHIGKAGETELERWKNDRNKAAFVLSEGRDREYEELLFMRRHEI